MPSSDPTELATKTKEELIEQLRKTEQKLEDLKKIKKWGLVWDDQPQAVIEDWKHKLPILEDLPDLEITTKYPAPMNLLIKGDNYNALSVLNYTHQKKVDMIYIDPPYNTHGNLMYNNKYVNEDDKFIHSKFLSILYHRLKIAKKLLKPGGVICCTIDDQELISILGSIERLDLEVLNIVVIVNKPEGRAQDKHIRTGHEYAIFFKIKGGKVPNSRRILPRTEQKQPFNETASDGRKFRWDTFYRRGDKKIDPESESRWYEIYVEPTTFEISAEMKDGWEPALPIDSNGTKYIWDMLPDDFAEAIAEQDPNDPNFKAKKDKNDRLTIRRRRWQQYYTKPFACWTDAAYNSQDYGSKLIPKIIDGVKFDYPKSIFAVFDCLDIFLPENGIVLDFFAGSGTTGHATQMLNMRDDNLAEAFGQKYGQDWHTDNQFLNTDAKLYAHFDPGELTEQELSEKWELWRRNRSQRRFILCTNNELDTKQLEKMHGIINDPSKPLCDEQCSLRHKHNRRLCPTIEQKKEWGWQLENHPEGICRKITYPRMVGISQGFKWTEEQARKLLHPLTSIGHILQTPKLTSDIVPGFTFKMKYYQIGFVPSKESDGNQKLLTNKAIEMFCIKEDCFEKVKTEDTYAIFKNPGGKHLGIVFDDDGIELIINDIKAIANSPKFVVYVLTYDKNSRKQEFVELKDTVEVVTVPKDINQVYKNVKRQYYNDRI
jgi:DNA modification methylase